MAEVPDDVRDAVDRAAAREADIELIAELFAADTEPDDPLDAPARTATTSPPPAGLTEREVELLDFERQWWKQPGSKEQAVRDRFAMSSTRYYQLVNALVEREAALRHDPMLVKRLRRARAQRIRTRTARRLGMEER
jgi:hypothetical protein